MVGTSFQFFPPGVRFRCHPIYSAMVIDIKYNPYNDLRWCEFDQCWVREILTNGIWYLFYSSDKARLEQNQLKHTLEKMKGMNFHNTIAQLAHQVPKEYQGYCHIYWDDFSPKSGGILKEGCPAAYWKSVLQWPTPGKQPTPPVNYEIVK